MWKSFVVLLIVATNLCKLLDSYKIITDQSPKSIAAYDQQDTDLHEEYTQDNYSNDDSYKHQFGRRVVIGKWRNNGEALEPKWRDGDSVPLAPFSTISFKNGWRKETDSREDYQIERDGFTETRKNHLHRASRTEENEREENRATKGNSKPVNPERREYENSNSRADIYPLKSETLIPTTEIYQRQKIGQKNNRRDRELNKELHPVREDNVNEDFHGAENNRESFQNYPNEYELFENENDHPRPRKRRPPETYELPGSWTANNRRKESHAEDEAGLIAENQPNMANDIRRYLITNENPVSSSRNESRSQENVELKTFLKMQGNNLSLSEILQQKNLTLADLLKGKPNAINILKADDKKPEFTEPKEILNPINSTSENVRVPWSQRRRIVLRKFSKNATFDGGNDWVGLNFSSATTSQISNLNNSTDVGEIANNISSFNPTELNDRDNNGTEEFVNPIKDRESLLKEETIVVENVTKLLSPDEKFLPQNKNDDDDEDEIMEFSDYPGKIPKFVVQPVLYEGSVLNGKRKTIPPSAIRPRNPVEKIDSKLSIENILSPEKKLTKIIGNETGNVGEDLSESFNKTGSKNIGIKNGKNEDEEASERLKDEKEETESPGNEDKDIENDFTDVKPDLKTKTLGFEVANNRQSGHETLPKDEKNFTLNHKFHEVVIPKVDPQSRAEILELFSSGSSAERLERLLISRNMTIEELIALRQRGSSQVHFAEVFKAREQTSTTSLPKSVKSGFKTPQNIEEVITNERNESTKDVHLSSKENNGNLRNSRNVTKSKEKETENSANDLLKNFFEGESLRNNLNKTDTGTDNLTINSEDLKYVKDSTTTVENIQRDSDGSSYFTSIEEVKVAVSKNEIKRIPGVLEERKEGVDDPLEIGRVEEILENDINAINAINTEYAIGNYEYTEKKAQSKVKPSIIASGGILGVTIVVFLSIFIACRIRQKKKFTYKNSFTKAVFHNPVMNARKLSNTSSVNTIMVDVVATSTSKRSQKHELYQGDDFGEKSDIDNDSLDANDSWDTIPDFMK